MALSTTGMLMLRTGPVHVTPSPSSTTKLRDPPCSTMVVECSSRPQKKATAHHMKTRPKKTQPWDVKRKGPTAYAPLPPLPPDWTLVSSEEPPLTEAAAEETEAAVAVTVAP